VKLTAQLHLVPTSRKMPCLHPPICSHIYTVAYLPHARTVEPQKPRNTHATVELKCYSLLLGDGQRANELTQWKRREMFSVQSVLTKSGTRFSVRSARRLCNATLVIFGNQFQMRQFSSKGGEFQMRRSECSDRVQSRVDNSRGRSTRTRQRIRTRSTEENKRSACEVLNCE
jgi:hypothetical protein